MLAVGRELLVMVPLLRHKDFCEAFASQPMEEPRNRVPHVPLSATKTVVTHICALEGCCLPWNALVQPGVALVSGNVMPVGLFSLGTCSWEADKKSDTWDDLDSTKRKHLRNLFTSFRRLARLMLLHSESFPLMKKDNRTECKQPLRAIGKESEEQIRIQLKIGDKSVTMHKVLRHPAIKDMETSLELPANTPEPERRMLTN